MKVTLPSRVGRGFALARLLPLLVFAVSAPSLATAQVGPAARPAPFTAQQYEQDFVFLWQQVKDEYAYPRTTDWERVRTLYQPRAKNSTSRGQFIGVLEAALDELYDFHVQLGTNTDSSARLVPTAADVWVEWRGARAVVTDVRPESVPARLRVQPGWEVVAVNGVPTAVAARRQLGQAVSESDSAARAWALMRAVTGRHGQNRKLQLRTEKGKAFTATIPYAESSRALTQNRPLLEYRRMGAQQQFGYIRPNNSLGRNELIARFDSALGALRNTKGLIMDLRETPSGGNSTVARAILSRFVSAEQPYQKHLYPAEERAFGVRRSWLEIVSPRGEFAYQAPVVVLVNRWTGSMGEGLAIGFHGTGRATVVGTEMARLMGAVTTFTLPNTHITFNLPTERLFTVQGVPREAFRPPVWVDVVEQRTAENADPILTAGLRELASKTR